MAILFLAACRPGVRQDYNQGLLALDERDFSEAARCFERAVLANDHEADAHLQLGILYERQPDKVCLAVWHYRAYLAFEPQDEGRLTVARNGLERAEKMLMTELQDKLDQSTEEERVMRVKLMEEFALRQKRWITQLEKENLELRKRLAKR